jgi:hypothetical protein
MRKAKVTVPAKALAPQQTKATKLRQLAAGQLAKVHGGIEIAVEKIERA